MKGPFFPCKFYLHSPLPYLPGSLSFIFSPGIILAVKSLSSSSPPSFLLLSSKKELDIPSIISCDASITVFVNKFWSP